MPRGKLNKQIKKTVVNTNKSVKSNQTLKEIHDEIINNNNEGNQLYQNKDCVFENFNINDDYIRSFKLKQRLQQKMKNKK